VLVNFRELSAAFSFENKVLSKIYGPVYDGYCCRSCNMELRKLFQEPEMVKIIKIARLRKLRHRMRTTNNPPPPPARRMTKAKPWGRRRDGRPYLRWMDRATEDLYRMRISNWKDKAGDRRAWRNILRKDMIHEEL
jgi:hypothetical protein